MKYLFKLVCLFIVQKTYSSYLWLCIETLSHDCDYHMLTRKIQSRVKIFRVFLNITRLSPIAVGADEAKEVAKLREVAGDMYSKYHNKINALYKQ